jgi:hypothetical protein
MTRRRFIATIALAGVLLLRDAVQIVVNRYVIVTRSDRLPIERFVDIESAADYIVRERAFGRWKVLVQEANRITAGTPYRELREHEKRTLMGKLFPTLYE